MDSEQPKEKGAVKPASRQPSLALEVLQLLPGKSVFAGDLSAVHPPDLLNFLHQGRRTGILFATHGEIERAVVLSEGAVAWAASTAPGERFGEIVCRLGILSRGLIALALEEQAAAKTPIRLGDLLAEQGLLDAETRARALRYQVIEIFLGLLVLQEGRFTFRAGFDPARLPTRLSLDVESLLLDGLRRLDEMDHFRHCIPSSAVVPQATGLAAPAELSDQFSTEMKRLLEVVDGQSPLSTLSETSALGEFEATKAAFRLMETGHLVQLGAPPPRERSSDSS